MKINRLKATYSIEANRDLHIEIRVKEDFDGSGKPVIARDFNGYEEGMVMSELFIRSEEDPGDVDQWAFNHLLPMKDGDGRPESFFEHHFSKEDIRRRVMYSISWDDTDAGKNDPRISWLYYKRQFDAVFPMIKEWGKASLDMEIEGVMEDGRNIRFIYSTGASGKIYVEDEYAGELCLFSESALGEGNVLTKDTLVAGEADSLKTLLYLIRRAVERHDKNKPA